MYVDAGFINVNELINICGECEEVLSFYGLLYFTAVTCKDDNSNTVKQVKQEENKRQILSPFKWYRLWYMFED